MKGDEEIEFNVATHIVVGLNQRLDKYIWEKGQTTFDMYLIAHESLIHMFFSHQSFESRL